MIAFWFVIGSAIILSEIALVAAWMVYLVWKDQIGTTQPFLVFYICTLVVFVFGCIIAIHRRQRWQTKR